MYVFAYMHTNFLQCQFFSGREGGAPGELSGELSGELLGEPSGKPLVYPSGEQAWGEAFWEPLVEDSGELPAQVKAACRER